MVALFANVAKRTCCHGQGRDAFLTAKLNCKVKAEAGFVAVNSLRTEYKITLKL